MEQIKHNLRKRYQPTEEVRDFSERGQAKTWQEKDALRYLRTRYPLDERRISRKLRTALAIYVVFTEFASNQAKEIFKATYANLAKNAGVSVSTVRRYASDLIKFGLLKKRNIKSGKANLANEWMLLKFNPTRYVSVPNDEQTIGGGAAQNEDQSSRRNDAQPSVQQMSEI